jgi:general secretion pathway protein G
MLALIIVILGLLNCPPKLMNRRSIPKRLVAKIQIAGLQAALQSFRIDNGRYPTTDEGLTALIHCPGNLKSWKGPYLMELPRDPWGRFFIYGYAPQNGTYSLISYGQHEAPGGVGEDIRSNRELPK